MATRDRLETTLEIPVLDAPDLIRNYERALVFVGEEAAARLPAAERDARRAEVRRLAADLASRLRAEHAARTS